MLDKIDTSKTMTSSAATKSPDSFTNGKTTTKTSHLETLTHAICGYSHTAARHSELSISGT